MEVRKPYLQRAEPNSTQSPIFNYYQRSLVTNNGIPIAMVTEKTSPRTLELFQTTPRLHATNAADAQGMPGPPDVHGVVTSAFDPLLGKGMITLKPVSGDMIELLHTQEVDLTANFSRNIGYTPSFCQPMASNSTQPGDAPECQMFPF